MVLIKGPYMELPADRHTRSKPSAGEADRKVPET